MRGHDQVTSRYKTVVKCNLVSRAVRYPMRMPARECAGPPPRDIPSDAPEIDIKLLPFGATDVRMGVLPYVWRDPLVEEAIEFV